ncbi:histidine phosphatase family protein [Flavobacteriaceae bacterium]|nr:histidine phosphatase family protein [Flavobacteriaceae bacterium]MDB2612877.1 histidine phosphatase family protein [Flavobacteriaceae bacterium]
MKHFTLLILSLILTAPTLAQNTEKKDTSTTFYFIRHAEKNRSDKENKNPNLTQKGVLRAAKWSLVFQNINFDAVYTTTYQRTRQTALPTAEKNGLKLSYYNPSEINRKNFLFSNTGKTVLVVGHSNTTPQLVNMLLETEKYPNIDDNNNANLYILTFTPNGKINDSLLVID